MGGTTVGGHQVLESLGGVFIDHAAEFRAGGDGICPPGLCRGAGEKPSVP